MEYIQLKQGAGIRRFGIKTADGKDTGEYIEIDVEDISLPIRASECIAKHKENWKRLQEKFDEADKLPNKNTDGFLTEKEKAMLEALEEFYKAEAEALDGVLGEGGTRKMLGGRKPYVTMYEDINEYLEPVIPEITLTTEKLAKSIKEKYSTQKEENVL